MGTAARRSLFVAPLCDSVPGQNGSFRDDDLVPPGDSSSERDEIVRRVRRGG